MSPNGHPVLVVDTLIRPLRKVFLLFALSGLGIGKPYR